MSTCDSLETAPLNFQNRRDGNYREEICTGMDLIIYQIKHSLIKSLRV